MYLNIVLVEVLQGNVQILYVISGHYLLVDQENITTQF